MVDKTNEIKMKQTEIYSLYTIDLENPEYFEGLEYAQITVYNNISRLFYKMKRFNSINDMVGKNERGAKLIFGKEFGKGAKWSEFNQ